MNVHIIGPNLTGEIWLDNPDGKWIFEPRESFWTPLVCPHRIVVQSDHATSDWRKACRVVRHPRSYYVSVESPCGDYWLSAIKGEPWVAYEEPSDGARERGNFGSEDAAIAALASCTTPPPSWKEPTCSKESVSSSAGSSSATKPQPSTPTPTTAPALRPASEVAIDVRVRRHFDDQTEGVRQGRVVTADRIAVLEWARDMMGPHWPSREAFNVIVNKLRDSK